MLAQLLSRLLFYRNTYCPLEVFFFVLRFVSYNSGVIFFFARFEPFSRSYLIFGHQRPSSTHLLLFPSSPLFVYFFLSFTPFFCVPSAALTLWRALRAVFPLWRHHPPCPNYFPIRRLLFTFLVHWSDLLFPLLSVTLQVVDNLAPLSLQSIFLFPVLFPEWTWAFSSRFRRPLFRRSFVLGIRSFKSSFWDVHHQALPSFFQKTRHDVLFFCVQHPKNQTTKNKPQKASTSGGCFLFFFFVYGGGATPHHTPLLFLLSCFRPLSPTTVSPFARPFFPRGNSPT